MHASISLVKCSTDTRNFVISVLPSVPISQNFAIVNSISYIAQIQEAQNLNLQNKLLRMDYLDYTIKQT